MLKHTLTSRMTRAGQYFLSLPHEETRLFVQTFLWAGRVRVDAVDLKGQTILMWAVSPFRFWENNVRIVNILLDTREASINARTSRGETALSYAVKNGQLDAAKLLESTMRPKILQPLVRLKYNGRGIQSSTECPASMRVSNCGSFISDATWGLVVRGQIVRKRDRHGCRCSTSLKDF